MKFTPMAIAVSALVTALSGTVQAQSLPVAALVGLVDTNGDGTVSRDEIVAARERLFERLDANNDGNLDAGEIEALRDAIMDRALAVQARLASQWRRMDTDRDGNVTVEEFRGRAVLFELADRDRNGRLSPTEISVVRELFLGNPG